MKSNLFALLLLGLCTLISCDKDEGSTPNEVMIRLENKSIFQYTNVIVTPREGEKNFGDIASGEVTSYQKFQSAYSYEQIDLFINGKKYTIQPIDFIGENLLNPGDYTYIINADSSDQRFDRLTLELKED